MLICYSMNSVYAPRNATVDNGNFTVTTMKGRSCFNCLDSLTREDSTPKMVDRVRKANCEREKLYFTIYNTSFILSIRIYILD